MMPSYHNYDIIIPWLYSEISLAGHLLQENNDRNERQRLAVSVAWAPFY